MAPRVLSLAIGLARLHGIGIQFQANVFGLARLTEGVGIVVGSCFFASWRLCVFAF